MFVLRREDQTIPFATVKDLSNFKIAVKEELTAEEVKITELYEDIDFGESTTAKCIITDDEGYEYSWEIEITKVVSY